MQGEPDERASSQEEAEPRVYRRIVDALGRDDIDELAAALGQVPDTAWHAPDSDGGRHISQGGPERGSLWSGLRRLATMLQPRPADLIGHLGRRMPDPPYGPSPLQREYRNKFNVVVRSPTSAGWDWAVDVDAARSGAARPRARRARSRPRSG